MPDYGEIFCDAVSEIVDKKITGLAYDYTQVCEVIDTSQRHKGIYRVQEGQAKFQVYSSVTTYEVGDIVYVITPSNDINQQKIILAKKQVNEQQPVTYINPFNDFIQLSDNLINDIIYEKKLIANYKSQDRILVWSSVVREGYAGFTRLGLSALFQSSIPEAIVGTYGIEIRLYSGENNELVKILDLNSQDMYGNPYGFNGYYKQQKVFDISTIPFFNKIELYFYQDNDFKDIKGEFIPYKDNLGIIVKPNLFMSNPQIYFGYDKKEQLDEGIILYTTDSLSYAKENGKRTVRWRFIKTYNDNTYKLISDFNELPFGYLLKFYKYNSGAKYSSVAGANWEFVMDNLDTYEFTTDSTVDKYKYKAVIVHNNKTIYESNELEFTNVLDIIGERVNQLSNNFYIQLSDESDGEYYLYENGKLTTGKDKKRYAYPAFKNDKNESEYIAGVERVKWIVPCNKTMINLELPDNSEIYLIEIDLGTTSIDNYLEELELFNKFNYFQYKDNYYVYFLKPANEKQQRICYSIKENLDINWTDNIIKCYIKHNNYTAEKEKSFYFGTVSAAPKEHYTVEVNFKNPEVTGFYTDTDINGVKKEIIANAFDSNGEKINFGENSNYSIEWKWYEPETNEGLTNIIFNTLAPKDNTIQISFKDNITDIQTHHSILQATLKEQIADNEYATLAEGYFPIPVYKNKTVLVNNIIEQIQYNGNYNGIISGEYVNQLTGILEKLIPSISSSFDKDGNIDAYKPQIIDGKFLDISTLIENLKALYCYEFRDINNNLIAAIPAFRIKIPEKKNNEVSIGALADNSGGQQRAIDNEQYYPYKIIKSDLSSGKLVENEKTSHYNGLVIGQVQQRAMDNSGKYFYDESKYGIYGFKENEMTFSIDEEGDAFFKGKVEAGSGNIGDWQVIDGTLRDQAGKIVLDPTSASISLGGIALSPDSISLGADGKVDGINITQSISNINDDIKGIGDTLDELKGEDITISNAVEFLSASIDDIKENLVLDIKPENNGGRWATIKYVSPSATSVKVKDENDNLIEVIPFSAIKTLEVFIKGNYYEELKE